MKKLILLSTFLFSTVLWAQAPEKIRRNELQLGIDGSTADKVITIDVGDGASNPKITVTQADKLFSFSTVLDTVAETIQLGDGDPTGDQCLEFDTGDLGSNKKVCILDTSKDASINSDLIIGDGTAADKTFTIDIGAGANNPQFKWDNAAGRLQFTNDGSSFKNIGAGGGGGGGINLLSDNNFDFEAGDPPSDFTATGGTFVSETTNPGFDDASGSWNASATGQFLRSTAVTIPEGLWGRSCSARIQYKWNGGTATDLGWRVEDSSDVLIAGGSGFSNTAKDLDPASDWREDIIFFTCPSSGDMRIEIESSADAALLLTDNWELGQVAFSNHSQSELVAHAYYPDTASCAWSTASDVFAAFPADSDCPAITVLSSTRPVDAADNDLPDIDFDYLPSGTYKVTATFAGGTSTNATTGSYELSDGTDSRGRVNYESPNSTSTRVDNRTLVGVFSYTTGGARNFAIHARRIGGANNMQINNTGVGHHLIFTVERFPLNAAEAVNLETSGFFVDVNIGGANPSLGTSSVAAYTAIADAGLDLVNNNPSVDVKIPCDGGNPSTGTTCSVGDEIIGVVFNAPTAGRYKACFDFNHQSSADVAGLLELTFQVVETADGSATILSEGNTRIGSSGDSSSSVAGSGLGANSVCGTFDFSSAGTKALKLAYEQSTAPNVGSNIIRADRSSSVGQRDVHITVEKLNEGKPTPVFTDLQNSLNQKANTESSGLRLFSAAVDNAGTVLTEYGSWIDSTASGGTGIRDVNILAGYCDDVPVCTVSPETSFGTCATIGNTTTTLVQVRTGACGGSASDAGFAVRCSCVKN